MTGRAPVSICLRREIDIDDLCRVDSCDEVRVLGSFWPNSRTSFESHLAKAFKEANPVTLFRPHINQLCEFYAEHILDGIRPDWVCRVLSSSEMRAEHGKPQSLLADVLCRRAGASDISHLFHKSSTRPSMRSVARLSGPDALKSRIHYVIQDLFIRPASLGGSVLLVDDIMNTGASMRVYARALKCFAGVERVFGANLAATRFSGGKDGRGMLKLDVTDLRAIPGLREAWVDAAGVFHMSPDCSSICGKTATEVRFVAERKATPCAACSGAR